MAQEKEIKNFVFNYTDGTSKTVEKGFFCHIKDEPNLTQIVLGCVELGTRLGMFDKKESEEISE